MLGASISSHAYLSHVWCALIMLAKAVREYAVEDRHVLDSTDNSNPDSIR